MIKKYLKRFIIFLLVFFSLSWSGLFYELLFNPYSEDLEKLNSSRSIFHTKNALDWILQNKLNDIEIKGFTRTVYMMGHSYMSLGLLNIHTTYKNKSELSQASQVLVQNVLNSKVADSVKLGQLQEVKGEGIYLAHANLILIINRIISKSTENDELIIAISKNLSSQAQNEKLHHIVPPYKYMDDAAVFPADHSATLLSLFLVDKVFKSNFFGDIYNLYKKKFESTDVYKQYGLYQSGMNYKHEDVPRGVGVAYQISLTNYFDPDFSMEMYETFKRTFTKKVLGIRLFREYPQGYSGEADVDSGPIIFGVSTAANAMILSSTKFFRDKEMYTDLNIAGGVIGMPYRFNGDRNYLMKKFIFNFLNVISKENSRVSSFAKLMDFFTDACLFHAFTTKDYTYTDSMLDLINNEI